jgi:hypothetical protein
MVWKRQMKIRTRFDSVKVNTISVWTDTQFHQPEVTPRVFQFWCKAHLMKRYGVASKGEATNCYIFTNYTLKISQKQRHSSTKELEYKSPELV